jgi:uncharacterized membrane protein YeaQ/YmgE (transglycosylase-associated protein family)
MSSVIMDLIILMVAGIVGGNAVGTWPKYDLGKMWNTITGAVGGAVGGEVLQAVMQFIGVGSGVGSIITPVAGGCVAGAIFTMLLATFKRVDS